MKRINWWRLFAVVFGIYLGISAYSGGLWNTLKVVGLVFCLYQFGRFSYEQDATPPNEGGPNEKG